MAILVLGRAQGLVPEKTTYGLIAGFLSGQIENALSRSLPVDTVDIQPGEEGWEGTKVSAGKYITRWLFVRYAYRFGAKPDENAHEIHMEFRLTPLLSIESFYGDGGQGAIDFFFRKRF